jgi:hypothetical protein
MSRFKHGLQRHQLLGRGGEAFHRQRPRLPQVTQADRADSPRWQRSTELRKSLRDTIQVYTRFSAVFLPGSVSLQDKYAAYKCKHKCHQRLIKGYGSLSQAALDLLPHRAEAVDAQEKFRLPVPRPWSQTPFR